jgi:hypothetical protein
MTDRQGLESCQNLARDARPSLLPIDSLEDIAAGGLARLAASSLDVAIVQAAPGGFGRLHGLVKIVTAEVVRIMTESGIDNRRGFPLESKSLGRWGREGSDKL